MRGLLDLFQLSRLRPDSFDEAIPGLLYLCALAKKEILGQIRLFARDCNLKSSIVLPTDNVGLELLNWTRNTLQGLATAEVK